MKRLRVPMAALTLLAWQAAGLAGPESLVPGYTLTKVSPDPGSASFASYEGISQLAFDPGDNAHVYAARSQFVGSGFTGEVTRYDYNAATGQLSNPLDVATGLQGTQGLAFDAQGDLFVTTNHNVYTAGGTGGIEPTLPCVAALSAAHLAALILPTTLRRLYIAEEADPAGRHGARQLAERAESQGIEARPLTTPLADLNAYLLRHGADDLRGAGAGTTRAGGRRALPAQRRDRDERMGSVVGGSGQQRAG